MSLETASYINQLNASYPLGSDPISSGDDHIRLIKSAIKATFPNITGPVNKTQDDLNVAVAPLASPALTGTPTAPTAAPGTSTTQLATTAFVQATAQAALQSLHPVGSVYINATNSANPGTLLGFGTWVAFGSGRVPVGYDSSDSLFNAAEKTGGSKNAVLVSHTHTATVTDPGHAHTKPYTNAAGAGAGSFYNGVSSPYNATTDTALTGITVSNSTEGSSATNANVQPYVTVYMWKRTA